MLSVVAQPVAGQSLRCCARVALMQDGGPARRLMRECRLTSRQPVKHHYRVNEDKSPPLPNLLNRQFNPAAPNRVWCGDISFIRLQDKWQITVKHRGVDTNQKAPV